MEHLFIAVYSVVTIIVVGPALGMLVWAAGKDGEKQRRVEQNLV